MATFVGFAKNMTVTEVNADNEDDIIVGVSLPSLQDEHVANIYNEIQSVFPSYNLTAIVYDAQDDSSMQITQIDYFITQGVNVIVVMPVDENALISVLTNAAQEGIFIIVIGPDHGLYPSATYKDFNYAGMAEAEADDFLNNHWDPNKDITVLVIACNNDHGTIYYQEIYNKFSNYPNIFTEVIFVNGPNEVYTQIQAWIDANDGRLPDGIFICCREIAQAVENALIALGFEYGPGGIPVYGLAESNRAHYYKELVESIADAIQKFMNGDEPTGDDAPYLVDICNGEDEY